MIMGVIRFGWLANEIDERAGSAQAEESVSVSASKGVIQRSDITGAVPRADDLGNYRRCRGGDIVINRMSAYQGALGLAPRAGIVSPDYAVLRSTGRVDSRYLNHLMRSVWFVSEMTMRLRGIGAPGATSVRTPRVNSEDLADIDIVLPTPDEQRRIADFLDDQVARIDKIIAARGAQMSYIEALAKAECRAYLMSRRSELDHSPHLLMIVGRFNTALCCPARTFLTGFQS